MVLKGHGSRTHIKIHTRKKSSRADDSECSQFTRTQNFTVHAHTKIHTREEKFTPTKKSSRTDGTEGSQFTHTENSTPTKESSHTLRKNFMRT